MGGLSGLRAGSAFPLLFDSSPCSRWVGILLPQLGLGRIVYTQPFDLPHPSPSWYFPFQGRSPPTPCPIPSKRAPQPAMEQAVPAGGSRGPWGRHTGRAAPVGFTGVHSCTRARSLWKVRGSNWEEGGAQCQA